MFGKITEINENIVTVDNLSKLTQSSLLNYHVIFEEQERKVIGEITGITEKEITITLLGEIINNKFVAGLNKKPGIKSVCRIISKGEIEYILGPQNYQTKSTILIGNSSIYDGYHVTAQMNDFLSTHFAVIGNTGSGKSCGVAKLLQNIFYYNTDGAPNNAHIVLFDVYGEYNSAFANLNKIPFIHFKNYTTNPNSIDNIVKIPPYFLETDDLALLLNATDEAQIPIIEKALKLCYIFTSRDTRVATYKNDIIAKCLLDILSSGKEATQIRDQVVSVLTNYHTESLNLETIIAQPGYSRTLKQCLNIDAQGKINAVGLVVDFLNQYTKIDLDKIDIQKNFFYTLDDLYYAFEFALISEGTLNSSLMYDKANSLKVRLHAIINSDNYKYFDFKEIISKAEYIRRFFTTSDGSQKPCQIVNLNFNYIDDRFAKVLAKIFAKLFFNYATSLEKRASFPIHMILEEAHRYVQQDKDINIIGYNIFDRITKEGRKYDVILGFITQRPSELSNTALSQCSNFIVFRMFHPKDIEIVSSISSNISSETIEKLKNLTPGTAMVFGSAFKIPLMTKLELPNPMPESTSVNVINSWYQ